MFQNLRPNWGGILLRFWPRIGKKSVHFSSWSLSESFSAFFGGGVSGSKWHLEDLYWLWVHKALVHLVSSNQSPYPPFNRQRKPIPPPQKEGPQDYPGKGSTTHPHPTLTPPTPPTTPTQRGERERERGQNQRPSNRPKLYIPPEKTINAHPKAINALFPERGFYGFP